MLLESAQGQIRGCQSNAVIKDYEYIAAKQQDNIIKYVINQQSQFYT